MCKNKETYNGWSNYATWRINLEILQGVENIIREEKITFEDVADLKDYLKEEVLQAVGNYGENEEGLAYNYACAFCDDVNYHEIALNMVENNSNLIKQ